MKTAVFAVIVILTGVVSAIATEVATVSWLKLAPLSLDVTGRFFLFGLPPAIVLISVLAGLLLWKIFARDPLRWGALFLGSWATSQAVELTALGNPPANVALYVAEVLLLGGIVLLLYRSLCWRRRGQGSG